MALEIARNTPKCVYANIRVFSLLKNTTYQYSSLVLWIVIGSRTRNQLQLVAKLFQNGAYISEITLITLKVRLRQCKIIFTSETYNVPLLFVTFVDSHGSQGEESCTSGRASILVPIFSEITVNSLKCVRAKTTVLSHRKSTS